MRFAATVFLIIAGVVLLSLESCFEPPQYSNRPEITVSKIEFYRATRPGDADTLILHIEFRDGDGDLGLDGLNNDHLSDPFHENFYFLEGAGSTILPNSTREVNITAPPPVPTRVPLLKNQGSQGKLVTHRTRNKPGFGYLPAFNATDLGCRNYREQYLIIPANMRDVIDSSYNIVATSAQGDVLIYDTLYFRANPNYFNLRIRFYQRVGSSLQEYSWENLFCTTFNGRFPLTGDETGPVEGTLKYKMESRGLYATFGVRPIALDVIVSDRALNRDSVRTEEFTLDRIRVN
jgi:hypothetical protein